MTANMIESTTERFTAGRFLNGPSRRKKLPPETVIMAVFQCFINLHPSPGCLFSTTLNFPHLSASQNLNDEKSPQVPKLSSKYGPDSNYCGLKSVPSLQATNQINAQCFWRGVVLCYEDLNRPRNSTLQAPNDMSITSKSEVPIVGSVGDKMTFIERTGQ